MGELAGYVLSALIGVSLGLMGSGGSILTVPLLVFLFGVRPTDAAAHSLIIVGVTALVAAVGQSRIQTADVRSALAFAIPSVMGVYLTRRLIMPAIPDTLWATRSFELTLDRAVMVAFAILMLVASLAMIRSRSAAGIEASGAGNSARLAFQGFLTGLVTGAVGAGGGFLIVPVLVILAKIPMKQAVTTSLMVIAANSLFGFIGDLQSGATIDWALVSSIIGLAVAGTFIGSYISRFIPGTRLKPMFGYFVLVMGLFIIGSEINNAISIPLKQGVTTNMNQPEITSTQLAAGLAAGRSLILLDVREAEEREISRLEGDIHIPMGLVLERLDELDKSSEIVVYCRTGNRSAQVA